jgi:3-hydroxymyristoyl/3-hydroxydecanoyl-(acyl carrier protein) dehydratase
MQLFERVEALDPRGSPWGRGYLRAALTIRPNQWFFPGHFKNDPCMPGTLMFEGCLQTMAFYMAALGYTISRDGWRFEPVPERPYPLSRSGNTCGQATDLRGFCG